MKIQPLVITIIFCMTLMAGLTLFTPVDADADTITLVADQWCPYNCKPGSSKPGYMIEIAHTIFAKQGHKVEYIVLPWARAVAETGMGRHNAVVGAIPEDAPNFIYPTIEIGSSRDGFYSKGGLIRYTGPASLKNRTVGTSRGYSYGHKTDEILSTSGARIVAESGSAPLRKNISKLAMGRLDLVIADESVMEYTLAQMRMGNLIKRVGSPEPEEGVFIAFSPAKRSSKKYARILSDGIIELRKSGKLQTILDKYGVKDWR